MKVNEYLAKRILEEDSVVFGITGGAAINLFDALHKSGVKLVPMHHEQACAMAADAYARLSGKLGICVVTSGPGATNLLTGTCCSFYDSIPILNISGQVPSKHLRKNFSENLRQYGFQETDVQELFSSVTKFSTLVNNSKNFISTLESAIAIACSQRPGPVIVDICDEIQREEIVETGFSDIPIKATKKEHPSENKLQVISENVFELMRDSKRPIVILGHGIHIAHYEKETIEFIEKLNMPIFLTWGALDLLDDDHPLNMRDFGVTSQRAGNFAIQNSDFIFSIGTKLDTHEVANYNKFAPNALKVIVDIDSEELNKIHDDKTLKICADLRTFINYSKFSFEKTRWDEWRKAIKQLRESYPICDTHNSKFVNPYFFMNFCARASSDDCTIITDAGQTLTWTMQGWKIKQGQRLITAFNHSPMGYPLPASVGAYYANHKPVICMIGDGGFQMNIQELQTIVHHRLPIKIFVLDNNGYGMIKQTQSDWNSLSQGVMCDNRCDLTFPEIERIAKAYKIDFELISCEEQLYKINSILANSRPCICSVIIEDGEKIAPKLKFGDDFENQKPYLDSLNIQKINESLRSIGEKR